MAPQEDGRGFPEWLGDRWLLGTLLVALLVRIAYAFLAQQIDPFLQANPLHGDAGSYDRIVRNILAGAGYGQRPGVRTAFWPPLYPLFLMALYSAFGYHLLVARLAQAFLGAIAAGATFLVARELYDRRVAVLAGLGIAFYPHLIYFGAWLIAEALYMALLALSLLLAVHLQARPRLLGFAGLGLLLGLDVLTKPATLLLVPLLLLWILVAFSWQPMRVRAGYLGVTVLALAVSVAPWTIRNYAVFDDWVLVSTNGGYTFYGANNGDAFGGHREGFPPPLEELSEPDAEREYYRRGLVWIVGNPDAFVSLGIRKLGRLLSPLSVASTAQDYPLPLASVVKGVYWAFLALAVVGMLGSLRRWREVLLLYTLILHTLAGALVFYGDARYTLPMVPALVVFASAAVVPALMRLRGRVESQSVQAFQRLQRSR